MVIDLKKYFVSDGLSETVECSLDLSAEKLNEVAPFQAPIAVRASFQGFSGSVLMKAECTCTVTMPCDRCFEETTQVWEKHFSHVLVRELNEEEDDDSYILVPGERLDLDELLYSDIMLEMPSKFLCSPDCKGLCPQCGKNLNKGECCCEKTQVDPRLEQLKQLLEE